MNIIDSYARLPIGLYQDIRALQEGATPYDDIDLRVKIMAMLTGQTEGMTFIHRVTAQPAASQ